MTLSERVSEEEIEANRTIAGLLSKADQIHYNGNGNIEFYTEIANMANQQLLTATEESFPKFLDYKGHALQLIYEETGDVKIGMQSFSNRRNAGSMMLARNNPRGARSMKMAAMNARRLSNSNPENKDLANSWYESNAVACIAFQTLEFRNPDWAVKEASRASSYAADAADRLASIALDEFESFEWLLESYKCQMNAGDLMVRVNPKWAQTKYAIAEMIRERVGEHF